MSTAEKIARVSRFLESEADPKILDMFLAMIDAYRKHQADWWDELSQEEKQILQERLRDSEHDPGIPHADVMRQIEKEYNVKL